MSLTERLAYILTADATQMTFGFGKGAQSAEALALAEGKVAISTAKVEVATARAAVVEAKATGDAEKLAAANVRLAAANDALASSRAAQGIAAAKGELAGAEKAAAGLTNQSGFASRALAGIGLGAAAGPLVAVGATTAAAAAIEKFGAESVHAYTSAVDGVRQYKAVAGGTAEEASRMAGAFHALGIPIETASSALFKFGSNVDANKAKLQSHGVVIATDARGNTDLGKTLLNTISAYQASTSAAERDQIAKLAMGKGAQALIPLLNASTQELKEFGDAAAARGELFSEKDLAASRQLGIDLRELKADAHGFGVEVGREVVPELDNLAKGLDAAAKKGHQANFGEIVGKGLTDLLRAAALAPTTVLEELGKHSKSTASDTDVLAKELLDRAKAERDATDETEADTTALESFVGALQSERSAQESVARAEQAVSDAKAEGAKKTQDEKAANDQLRKANESLTQAEQDLAKAKRDAPGNREKAINEEALATSALADAKRAVTVAEERFGITSDQAKEAVAKRRQAELELGDATQKRQDLEKVGERPQPVVDAEQRIAAAKDAQARAAEAKTKADQEDPVADLAKAEGDLRDKTLTELITRQKLSTEIGTFNTTFGQTLTMADLLNGKADALLAKLAQAQTDQAALIATNPDDFGPAGGVPGFEGGGFKPPKTTLPPNIAGWLGQPAPQPVANVTNHNVTVNAATNADPEEIGRAVIWAGRIMGY
jgi:hypothetical protein